VQIVKLSSLVKNLGLRRVEVLRLARDQEPPAKAYDPAPQIMDRKEESAPESRANDPVSFPLSRQARLKKHSLVDAQLGHGLQEGASGGEAETQHCCRFEWYCAAFEVLTRDPGIRKLEQLPGEPVVSCGDRTIQGLMGIGPGPLGSLWDGDSSAPRGLADRVGVAHAHPLHEPGEDVTRFVANEAIEPALLGDNGKIAIGTAMKGTGSTIVGAGSLERHRLADETDEIHAVADLIDSLLGNHAHAENSTMVTPVPPWLRGAKA
jgi:hypothetical protein